MNLPAVSSETHAPDLNAYLKFAQTSYTENKIVAGVDGRKIQIATASEDSAPKLSSYLTKEGLEMDLSQAEKENVINHFKAALALKYGPTVFNFFDAHQEQMAIDKGLSQKMVQDVTQQANLHELFELVRDCRSKLERALLQYPTFQKSSARLSPADRGETEFDLAKRMLQHQSLVAKFKTAAGKYDDQNELTRNMLEDDLLVITERDSIRTAIRFLRAAQHFMDAANAAMNNVDSNSTIAKKNAIAEGFIQRAKEALGDKNFNHPLLSHIVTAPEFTKRVATIRSEISYAHAEMKKRESAMSRK